MIVDISEILLQLGLAGTVTDTERAIAMTALSRAETAVKNRLRYDPTRKTHTEYYPQGNYLSNSGRESVWEANDTHAYLRNVSGSGGDELYLRHIPIRSITSLYLDYDARSGTRDGAFASGTLKTEGVDYWANYDMIDSDGNKVCSDGILRSIGLWSANPGSIKITYTAGYSVNELHGQDSVINANVIHNVVLSEAIRRAHKAFLLMKRNGLGWVAGGFTSESLGDYSYSADGSYLKMLFQDSDLTRESLLALQPFMNYGYELAG